jgi:hypothetical protein
MKKRTIFHRERLRPNQLRTVADRRMSDAVYLLESKGNARLNAAMYLGGFVIECLLKARLLEAYPRIQTAGGPEPGSEQERHLWYLCFRSHDLDRILDFLPGTLERLANMGQKGDLRLVRSLRAICQQWTIFARYSTRMADRPEAGEFINQIEELRSCLK